MKKATLHALVEALGPPLIRFLGATWRFRMLPEGVQAEQRRRGQKFIYAFWHGRMLVPTYTERFKKVAILVSSHKDGEFIARVVNRLGFLPVRGSSTRGGRAAMMGALKQAAAGHDIAFTPDGPRGPRYRVQRGVVYAASRTGLPLVACAVEAWPAWVLGSWDHFTIPKPFARTVILQGEPVHVPPDLQGEALEAECRALEVQMRELSERARRIVRGKSRETQPRPSR